MLDGDIIVAYQPDLAVDRISIKYVIDSLEMRGTDEIPVENSEVMDALSHSLEIFGEGIEHSEGNRLLKDL